MISKGEHAMTSLCSKSGIEVGLITSNQLETTFYLYEVVDGHYRKLGKADNPLELERRYKMHERMGLK